MRESEFSRLGPFVVLAGPNGGGKTRILDALKHAASAEAKDWAGWKLALEGHVSAPERESVERLLLACRSLPEKSHEPAVVDAFKTALGDLAEPARAVVPPTPELLRRMYLWRFLAFDEPRHAIAQEAQPIEAQRVSKLREPLPIRWNFSQACQWVEVVVSRWAHEAVTHQTDRDPEELADARHRAAEARDAFVRRAGELVGVEVTFDTSYPATRALLLDGRRIKDARLSDGQKILLAWSVMLTTAPEDPRKFPHIISIDEPEVHLHPGAALSVLRSLRQSLHSDSQIWLATHSVTLALGLEEEGASLFYVADGHAEYAGNKLDRVVEGLLGGADERLRIQAVLSDAADVEFFNYVAAELQPPTVASYSEADPQLDRTRAIVRGRVLDYSPGRGRLARALAAEAANGSLDYYALARSQYHAPEDLEYCREALVRLYPDEDPSKRLFADTDAALVEAPGKFDWVVLCNTLHEIDSVDWPETFRGIHELLSASGQLLLLEDQRLPQGEMPHPRGYVVLSLSEVRILFGAVEIENIGSNERLTAFSIPAAALSNVTPDTVAETLRRVKIRAGEALDDLKAEQPKTARTVRKQAYFSQLYVHADRQLERFRR